MKYPARRASARAPQQIRCLHLQHQADTDEIHHVGDSFASFQAQDRVVADAARLGESAGSQVPAESLHSKLLGNRSLWSIPRSSGQMTRP
ncbi:hypothetical protein CQZ88_05130 [Rhodococcus sp. ENV425]|nr:hypothetical protein CQZ88_05130 [Rhodococcus sp. ENV425]